MKKLFKTAVNFMAVALLALATFGLAACEDIKKLELNLSLYNYSESAFYAEDDVKFSVDLYRHLAPKTVDAVLERVKSGYYDDAIFYTESAYSSQIMVGDLKFDENGNLVQNLINDKLPPEVERGEFEYNGVKGSNLVNEKGAIGLWRSYYEEDGGFAVSSAARNSGRATWYIPTGTKTDYNGWLCLFGQYDAVSETAARAINAITNILSSNGTEYVIYFTGEYNSEKADENYGLEFHAVLKSAWDENYDSDAKTYDGEAVFVAEGDQLVYYNFRRVTVPKTEKGTVAAKISEIKIK